MNWVWTGVSYLLEGPIYLYFMSRSCRDAFPDVWVSRHCAFGLYRVMKSLTPSGWLIEVPYCYCHRVPLIATFFFSKVAPLFLDFFCITIIGTHMNITSQFNTSQQRRAFAMPSSCLRFLRRDNFAPKVEARGIQNGMKKSSTLYKVRAERACSLCRAKQRHEVTSPIL